MRLFPPVVQLQQHHTFNLLPLLASLRAIRIYRQPIHLEFSPSSSFPSPSESHRESSPFLVRVNRHTAATMDIALELCDTYALDWIYSAILPAQPAPYNLKDGGSNVTTMADLQSASPWEYKPSSNMISFEPTEYAYTSQWTRDNIYRQTLSLFFITW